MTQRDSLFVLAPSLSIFVMLSLLACSSAKDGTPEPPHCDPPALPCDESCVNVLANPSHCGACNNACEAGEVCDEGRCAESCSDSRVACGGGCVDLESDPAHCGACDQACGAGESCVGGRCSGLPRECDEGLTACEGGCVDLSKDAAHCGSCGNACPDGVVCFEGTCGCPEGLSLCDGTCVDTQTTDSHCGECGNACDDGLACKDGNCTCAEGLQACGEVCADTRSDPNHCSACGIVCEELPNVVNASTCSDSRCEFACVSGFDDCDDDWTTGCETELIFDPHHCNACGNDCEARDHVTAAECVFGECRIISCESGWGDCDLQADNGCETDTTDNPQHCGYCNSPCDESLPGVTSATCVDGGCQVVCQEGYADCEGFRGCLFVMGDDPNNCGACGTTCDYCRDGDCIAINSLDLGMNFGCISSEKGGVYCWGNNGNGQLGDGSTENSQTLVKVSSLSEVKILRSGLDFTYAVTKRGEVWWWGNNAYVGIAHDGDNRQRTPVQVPGLEKIVDISVGMFHVCAVDGDGYVYCWGQNMSGEVGDGTNTPHNQPYKVSGVSDAIHVAAGMMHTCAVTKTGELYCWGDNSEGQFGDGTKDASLVPKKIPGVSDATFVKAGYFQTCYIDLGGRMHCTGHGLEGNLGQGIFQNEDTYQQVLNLTGVQDIYMNDVVTCAVVSPGDELWCWGSNLHGLLGRPGPGTATPVKVEHFSNVTVGHIGEWYGMCVLGNNSLSGGISKRGLYCWGDNSFNLFGPGYDLENPHLPVPFDW